MADQSRIYQPMEHRTLGFTDTQTADGGTMTPGGDEAGHNRNNSWTVSLLKSIATAPFSMFRSQAVQRRSQNGALSNQMKKNCFKLIRVQKIRINNENLFEVRYVQYFTPHQLLPLFNNGKKKMQTRVQLINAVDSQGSKLSKKESMKLLKNALKSQEAELDVVLMPTMNTQETDFMLNNLKNATTLACGRTTHKVTRKHLRNAERDIIVNVSEIDVGDCEDLKPIASGLQALTKLVRKQKKIVVNELFNNMVNQQIEDKEKRLRTQLVCSKLSGVISKRLERVKFSAFNQIKLQSIKSHSMEKSHGEFGSHSSNTTNYSGQLNQNVKRYPTTSEFRITQSTNAGMGHGQLSRSNFTGDSSINRGSAGRRLRNPFMATSLIGNMLAQEQMTLENEKGITIKMSGGGSVHIKKSEIGSSSGSKTKGQDGYFSNSLKRAKELRKNKVPVQVQHHVPYRNKGKIVIDEDSEFEYILESEEEEEEFTSESEDVDTPVDKIFSNSFLMENDMNSISKKPKTTPRTENMPFEFVSKFNQNKEGNIKQLEAKKSTVMDNKQGIQIEERKEDSYVHPALDNSGAFSNISAIMGQQNFGRNSMASFQEETFDADDLEFEDEFSELYESEDKKKQKRKVGKHSMIESVSEGEYAEYQMDNNVRYLKNDMDRITKDLEKIRDLVMTTPDAKNIFDNICQETKREQLRKLEAGSSCTEKEETEEEMEESEYDLPEYNSREISDLINNNLGLSPRFQDKDIKDLVEDEEEM